MSSNSVLTWKIGGMAGQGQQVAGLIFAKTFTRGGYYTFGYPEFPSLIRGGRVTYQVSISEVPVKAPYRQIQLFLGLSQDATQYCKNEVAKDGLILYNSDLFKFRYKRTKNYPLPLLSIAKEEGIPEISSNLIAIGASVALLKYDLKILESVIIDHFKDKGKKVTDTNIKAARCGYQYAKEYFSPENFKYWLKPKSTRSKKIVVAGNEAVALGAIAAGCKFYVAYPMSPSSGILHYMADVAEKQSIVVKQPEDEIGGVNMALGAAWAGARSMIGTSGGGFALMNESFSLAGMTETPLVIVVAERPGPATGLPTWTEQGDLGHVVHAGHGEFPRVVLTPGDFEENFELTALAFNLAEKYQIPVIVLTDKILAEASSGIDAFNFDKVKIDRGKILNIKNLAKIKNYKRYQLTRSGVSARVFPGIPGGVHITNSDEHDEFGFSIEGFNSEMRKLQVKKRLAKIPHILKDLPKSKIYGPKSAKLTLLGWGSTKGPALEALKELPNVNYIHFSAAWPLSITVVKQATKGVKKLVVIENNATGQFADLLRKATGLEADKRLNKFDGHQFFPDEIISLVKKLR